MRVFYNDDVNVFFCNCLRDGYHANEETMRQYVRSFADSGITDLIINLAGQISMSPSKILDYTPAIDPNVLKVKNNEPHQINWLDYVYEAIHVNKLNPHAIFFDETRKCGISPWMSIRMNDVHINRRAKTFPFYAPTIEKAWNDHLTTTAYREVSGYFDDTLDYAKPEVRQMYLSYIEEQVNMYDVDGVELDFSREGFCFAPGLEEKGRKILLGFYQDVRNVLDKAGKKYGHKIQICIRTFPTPISDYRSGIDAIGAANAGLCDVIVACTHYGTTDDAAPIAIWNRLTPDNVIFAPNIENEYRPHSGMPINGRDDEQLFGLSHSFLCEGAKALYYYNDSYSRHLVNDEKKKVFSVVIQPEALKAVKKRFSVEYDDIAARGEHLVNVRLPVTLNDNVLSYGRYTDIRVYCGENDCDLYLLLGVDADAKDLTVYVNGTLPEYCGETCVSTSVCQSPVLVYKVKAMSGNIRCVEVKSNEGLDYCPVLSFVEMRNYLPSLIEK